MSRIIFSTRLCFSLLLVIVLSACGPAAMATEPSVEEAPAATEAPQDTPNVIIPTVGNVGDAETTVPTAQPAIPPTAQPAIPERRRLTLEFPPEIRAGDSDVVRLTLEVDDLGNLTPTAEVAGNVVTGDVIEIPNLYTTHTVIAEARFDIAGLKVSPPDLVSQPLAQGQSVSFYWSILPEGAGIYRGTIWLYLRFVDKVSGEESQRAVSAQPVEIEAVNLFGLSISLARSFGVIGSLIGTVIGFPFLEDIVKFFFNRRNKRRR